MWAKIVSDCYLLFFWTNYLDNETGKQENKAANSYYGDLRVNKTIIPRFYFVIKVFSPLEHAALSVKLDRKKAAKPAAKIDSD